MPRPRPQYGAAIPGKINLASKANYVNINPNDPAYRTYSNMYANDARGFIMHRAGLTEDYIQRIYQHPDVTMSYRDPETRTGPEYKSALEDYRLRTSGIHRTQNIAASGLDQLTDTQLASLKYQQAVNRSQLQDLPGRPGTDEKDPSAFFKTINEFVARSKIETSYAPGSYSNLSKETQAVQAQESINNIAQGLAHKDSGFSTEEVKSRIAGLEKISKIDPAAMLRISKVVNAYTQGIAQGTIDYGKALNTVFGNGGTFSPAYMESFAGELKASQKPQKVAEATQTIAQMKASGNLATRVQGLKSEFLNGMSDQEKLFHGAQLNSINTPYGFGRYKAASEAGAFNMGEGPEAEAQNRSTLSGIEYDQSRHSADEFQRMGWMESFQRFGTYATTQGFRRGAINLGVTGLMGKLPVGAGPFAAGLVGEAGLLETQRMSNEAKYAGQYTTQGQLGTDFFTSAFNLGVSPSHLQQALQLTSATGVKPFSSGLNTAAAGVASGLSPTQIAGITNPAVTAGMSTANANNLTTFLGATGFAGAGLAGTLSNSLGSLTDMSTVYGLFKATYGQGANTANQSILNTAVNDAGMRPAFAIFSGKPMMDVLNGAAQGKGSAYASLAVGAQNMFNMLGGGYIAQQAMGLTAAQVQAFTTGNAQDIQKAMGLESPNQTRSDKINAAINSAVRQTQNRNPLQLMLAGATLTTPANDTFNRLMSDPSLQDVKLNKSDLGAFTDNNPWGGVDRLDFTGNVLNSALARHNINVPNVQVNIQPINQGQSRTYFKSVGSAQTTSGPDSTNSAQNSAQNG